jgi:tetratricopeptide (TPR) repeat protein
LELARNEIARIGFRPFEGLFLAYQAEAQRRAGQIEEAVRTAERGIEAARNFGYPLGEAWAYRAKGRALSAMESVSEAQAALAESIRVFTMIGAQHEVERTEGDVAVRV